MKGNSCDVQQGMMGTVRTDVTETSSYVFCSMAPKAGQCYKTRHAIGASTVSVVLSLSREQFRVITGLLTGHNTLYKHLHLIGLRESPLCRKCGAEDETSAHILCKCESLASSRLT
jgi:hypothetical protein